MPMMSAKYLGVALTSSVFEIGSATTTMLRCTSWNEVEYAAGAVHGQRVVDEGLQSGGHVGGRLILDLDNRARAGSRLRRLRAGR